MAEQAGVTRRQPLLLDGVEPGTGTVCKLQISYERLQFLAKLGVWALLEARHLVPETLLHPKAIFEGLTREADEPRGRGVGWRCYVGTPIRAFRKDGMEIDTYDGEVFLVFVNHENVAYNWRWETSHASDKNLPADHADRFVRRAL